MIRYLLLKIIFFALILKVLFFYFLFLKWTRNLNNARYEAKQSALRTILSSFYRQQVDVFVNKLRTEIN